MNRMFGTRTRIVLSAVLGFAATTFAGKATKWEDVPKPVRDTVLANGGKEGPVDKESETKDGKAIYEASVQDKDGKVNLPKALHLYMHGQTTL